MPERSKGCPRACKAIARSPPDRWRPARGRRGPVREVGAGPARRHARPRCRARLRLPGPFDPVDPDTRRRCAPCRGVRGGPADRAAPRARRDHGHLRAAGRPAGCRRPSRDRRRSPRLRSVVRSPARVRLPRARRRCRPGARGARPPSRSDRRPLHGRCGRPGRTHPSRRPRHDPGLRPRAGEQHGERPGRSLAKPGPGRRPRAARARDVQSPPAPWGGPGPGQLRRRAPVEPRGGGARHRPGESRRASPGLCSPPAGRRSDRAARVRRRPRARADGIVRSRDLGAGVGAPRAPASRRPDGGVPERRAHVADGAQRRGRGADLAVRRRDRWCRPPDSRDPPARPGARPPGGPPGRLGRCRRS